MGLKYTMPKSSKCFTAETWSSWLFRVEQSITFTWLAIAIVLLVRINFCMPEWNYGAMGAKCVASDKGPHYRPPLL